MKKTGSCIVLFVKPPVPGKVKTRLARDIGIEAACALYRTLADRAVAAAVATGLTLYLCHDGDDTTLLPHNWKAAANTCILQHGDDLGERITNAFRTLFSDGHDQMVLIGSDIPGLDSNYLCDAFNLLKSNDLVIGPAVDGGYCLIGFHASTFTPALFQQIPWSSDQVLTLTLANAEAAGLSTALLPPLRDIDTLTDLHACFEMLPCSAIN